MASDASIITITLESTNLGIAIFERIYAFSIYTTRGQPTIQNQPGLGRDIMVSVVSRWLKCPWICVADGAYGNAKFGWACRRHGVSLVSRLPWKANLYDFAPVAPPRRQRGRPRTEGALLSSMQQRLEGLSSPTLLSDHLPLNESSRFQILRWYGGTHALRQLVTGTAVWDVDGYPPLPLRWVLVTLPYWATTAYCIVFYYFSFVCAGDCRTFCLSLEFGSDL